MTCTTPGGPISRQTLTFENDDYAEQFLSRETIRQQHVLKKQVNKHSAYTTIKCKQRAACVCVCPTSEPREPVHSCSPCPVSRLHQTGPVPKAWTGRPAHALTSGLHKREGLFPFSVFFFLDASFSISLYPSLPAFVTPVPVPPSLLFSLFSYWRVHRSQSPGKWWWTALQLSQLTL